MAYKLKDRIWDTTTGTGLGALTLANAAPTGFRPLSVLSDGDTTTVTITGRTTGTTETQDCTWNTGNILTRNTWLDGNTGSTVNWTNEIKDVQMGPAASKSLVNGSTVFNWAAPASLASAATVNIGAATSNVINITGTTTITAFDTIAAPAERIIVHAGIHQMTHNATSLILRGGANITTAVNDVSRFVSLGGGNWLQIDFIRAGTGALGPLIAGTAANNLVQLNGSAKLPAVDGSLLTNLPASSPVYSQSATYAISGTPATINFTGLNVEDIIIELVGVTIASSTSRLQMAVSTNNGSSYGSPVALSNAAASSLTTTPAYGNVAITGVKRGSLNGNTQAFSTTATGVNSSSGANAGNTGTFILNVGAQVNAIQLSPQTGVNWAAGTINIAGR